MPKNGLQRGKFTLIVEHTYDGQSSYVENKGMSLSRDRAVGDVNVLKRAAANKQGYYPNGTTQKRDIGTHLELKIPQ